MLALSEPRYKQPRSSERWTDERTAELTRLWNDGHSASKIAAELGGCTRNAVIGKVTRLGLDARRTVSFVKTSTGLARSSTPKPRVATVSPSLFARKAKAPKVLPIPPPVAPSLEFKIGFFALENEHCRYPLWDGAVPLHEQFYCGSPQADFVEGRSYCRFHQHRTQNPRRPE